MTCRFFAPVGLANWCHQWPDRPKPIADHHRDKVCVGANGRGCVWMHTINPARGDIAVPVGTAKFVSKPDAMALRTVSIMFNRAASSHHAEQWIKKGWLKHKRTGFAYQISRDDLLEFVKVVEAWPTYNVAEIRDPEIKEAAIQARLTSDLGEAAFTIKPKPAVSRAKIEQHRHDWTPEQDAHLLHLRAQKKRWKVIVEQLGIPRRTCQNRLTKLTQTEKRKTA